MTTTGGGEPSAGSYSHAAKRSAPERKLTSRRVIGRALEVWGACVSVTGKSLEDPFSLCWRKSAVTLRCASPVSGKDTVRPTAYGDGGGFRPGLWVMVLS